MTRAVRAVLAIVVFVIAALTALLLVPIGCGWVDTGPDPAPNVDLVWCAGLFGNHIPFFRTGYWVGVQVIAIGVMAALAVVLVIWVRRGRSSAAAAALAARG